MEARVLDRGDIDALIAALRADGYRVIGPAVRDGVIGLVDIEDGTELPDGIGVETGPGLYRLTERDDGAVFANSAGPQSMKNHLHPPRQRLLRIERGGPPVPDVPERSKTAFFGVRACDLASVGVLDTVLAGGAHSDEGYLARRDEILVIAVNCTEPGGTCFCASTGTGPRCGPGHDLVLTERVDTRGHWFLAEAGSPRGEALLTRVPGRAAAAMDTTVAHMAVQAAGTRMGRSLPEADLRTLLAENRESPRWADIAERCLTCANCTLVCPTCFCTTTTETTDLAGEHAERWEQWDSCFDMDFSRLHGGSVRTSGAARYRQWLTHKFSTWHDQFGSGGCVGCGRCVAWCPVGIDVTAELTAFAADEGPRKDPA